jgi:hypothetical protein
MTPSGTGTRNERAGRDDLAEAQREVAPMSTPEEPVIVPGTSRPIPVDPVPEPGVEPTPPSPPTPVPEPTD